MSPVRITFWYRPQGIGAQEASTWIWEDLVPRLRAFDGFGGSLKVKAMADTVLLGATWSSWTSTADCVARVLHWLHSHLGPPADSPLVTVVQLPRRSLSPHPSRE